MINDKNEKKAESILRRPSRQKEFEKMTREIVPALRWWRSDKMQ